jgi:hypothetical protein
MPVLIAAPATELDIVRLLAAKLREGGGEVRCYLEEDDHELRQIGCKIAAGALDDEMNLEAALTNVHTFIPLFPDPVVLQDAVSIASLKGLGRAMAAAASASSIEQTVVALPALSQAEGNLAGAYRCVEESLVKACRPLCLIRTGLLWGEGRPFPGVLRSLRGRPPNSLPGAGEPMLATVRIDDLVTLLAAVDDREQTHGEWEFGGNAYPLTRLIDFAGSDGPLIPAGDLFLELLSTGVTAGQSAVDEFGISPKPIEDQSRASRGKLTT